MSLPTLKRGSIGEAVRLWQQFLNEQNIPLDPESRALDGIFGVGTERGTKEYQARRGLPLTGIVDSQTYDKAVKDEFTETVSE
jgi:peptidoglycan hydrolase-like protein with peptidoglycan-binding domain